MISQLLSGSRTVVKIMMSNLEKLKDYSHYYDSYLSSGRCYN